MTTYTGIPDTAIDQDSRVTEPVMVAMRDNPIAMLEGSTGAPYNRFAWHPYDGVTNGDGNDGEIWSFTNDGAVTYFDWTGWSDGYEYAVLFKNMSNDATASFDMQVYMDTSLAWTTVYSSSLYGPSTMSGAVAFPSPRMSKWEASPYDIITPQTPAGVLTMTKSGIYSATSQTISGLRVVLSVGSFTSGSAHGLRRREFISGV